MEYSFRLTGAATGPLITGWVSDDFVSTPSRDHSMVGEEYLMHYNVFPREYPPLQINILCVICF